MNNGFIGRPPGMNPYQQQAGMNRFQQQNFNPNRGGSVGEVWQQPFQRQPGSGGFPQQNKEGNGAAAPSVLSNGDAAAPSVQSRLGPVRSPITAPGGATATKAEANKPVLLRPGQETKINKPAEGKIPTGTVKKIDTPADNKKVEEKATNPTVAAVSKPPMTSSTTVKSVAAAPPPSMTNALGSPRESLNRPPPGPPPAQNRPPPGPPPAQNNSSLAPTNHQDVKPNASPEKFAQNQGNSGGNIASRLGSNQGNDDSKGNLNENQGSSRFNQNAGNQSRFNQSNQDRNNPQGNKFGNQGSRFSGPNQQNQGGQQNNSRFGNANNNNQAGSRFSNNPANNSNQNSSSNTRFGNQGADHGDNNQNQNRGRFNNPNQGSSNNDEKNQPKFGMGNQGPRNNQGSRDNYNSSSKVRQGAGSGSSGGVGGNDAGGRPAAGGNRDYRREGPRGGGGGGRGGYNMQERLWDKVQDISGSQYDLEPLDMSERKFNAQSRLFVGSLPRDITLEELKEMFSKHGELGQVYYNKEGAYAFINFDYRTNSEKAMRELNATVVRGRAIKVRFAAITTGVRVKNLASTVTNELLHLAFGVFGSVESSRVSVDDRGKPTGDGMVIFTEKKSAVMAYKKCQEESYFLTHQLRPVIVEPWETRDDDEGYPEANIIKNEMYKKDRRVGPRFAELNSFESDYGKRWKQLFDIYKEKRLTLENDLKAEMEALEVKMQLVVHQQETDKLRKELAQREQEALQLQIGLGAYGEASRPTQLTVGGDEYGPYGGQKRSHDYYDAQGMDPRALGMDPRAHGMDPRAHGMDPRAQGMDPRAQGMDPRGQGLDQRGQGMEYRGGQSMDYRGGQYDQQQARGYDDYYRGSYDRSDDRTSATATATATASAATTAYDRQAVDQKPPTVAGGGSGSDAPRSSSDASASAAAPNPYDQQHGGVGYEQRDVAATAESAGYNSGAAGKTEDAAASAGSFSRPPPNAGASAINHSYEGVSQAGGNPYEAAMKRGRYTAVQ